MNSLKMTMLQYLIQAFVAQLSESTVKSVLAAAIAQIRQVVKSSETTLDDMILIPVLEAIETALKLD